MRIRSVSDAVYTLIAWLPVLALLAGVGWVLAVGLLNLELYSSGTSIFLDDSTNLSVRDFADGPNGQVDDVAALEAAYASGDPVAMAAALEEHGGVSMSGAGRVAS